MCYIQAQQIRAMFPHIPMQAITLDLADTRSISLTVEHILNNAIYIPDGDPGNAVPGSSATPTPTLSPEAPDSQEVPHPPNFDDNERAGQTLSVIRRRRGCEREERLTAEPVVIRDNRPGSAPRDEEEEEVMSFASLQRRKRELLANAKR